MVKDGKGGETKGKEKEENLLIHISG